MIKKWGKKKNKKRRKKREIKKAGPLFQGRFTKGSSLKRETPKSVDLLGK